MGRGALIATLAGNTLEFYDFISYTFFAVYIGKTFFPTSSSFASLLLSVATFGVGFLTRPLGGMWIGALADRAGRKPALLLTIVLMTIGTLGLVATPGYATIGIAAPIVLVVSRLVQGVALGGEVGAASAVLVESAPPDQRAIYMSLQSMSQGVANLFAGIVGLSLTEVLAPTQLASWGWRIAFAVGLILVPIGFYMRRALPETLPEPKHTSAGGAIRAVWRDHRRELVLIVLVAMCITISAYVASFMTTFAITSLHMTPAEGMIVPIALGLVTIVGSVFAGWVCERFGRKRTMIVSRLAVVVATIPLYMFLIETRSVTALVIVIVANGLLGAPSGVAAVTMMAELFPREIRGTSIAIAYGLTVTIFGATTQVVITWLIEVTGSLYAPGYYVMGAGLISVLAMTQLRETKDT